MKVSGIVAEYNPFHNGHEYLMTTVRQSGATHIICVMSGDFVQRAEPAVLDKFERAKCAVIGGADLVIELPVQYATASAERFARGAVQLLQSLGCVDELAFGAGTDSLKALACAADAAARADVIKRAKELSENGIPFAASRSTAIRELVGNDVARLVDDADNILAIEYIRMLNEAGSVMMPHPILRAGVNHDSDAPDGKFASAGLVRCLLREGKCIKKFVPHYTANALEIARNDGSLCLNWQLLERLLFARLRSMTTDEYSHLPDGGGGLAERLRTAAERAHSVEELFELVKTKRYAMSRVRRITLCALLGITNSDFFAPPYARILAVGRGGEELLNLMKRTSHIPFFHSVLKLSELGSNALRAAQLSMNAAEMYSLAIPKLSQKGRDCTTKLYNINSDKQIVIEKDMCE